MLTTTSDFLAGSDRVDHCKPILRELVNVIHKDPVKLRVALLAADPPDNT